MSSELINMLFAGDTDIPALNLHAKENFMNGISVSESSGNVLFETTPNAAGGEVVHFADGTTANLRETVEGGTILDLPGVENDIVTTQSIFGTESIEQGGQVIGTGTPDFSGGMNYEDEFGNLLFSTSPDMFGTNIEFSPLLDPSVGIDSVSNVDMSMSSLDALEQLDALNTVSDGLDALGFLGWF
ncbi:hypothetical protein SFC66_01750 [Terribacillus saccharophilus]|uniref:hypothetical protein n=1 Tax=Terribacillus saccharophilus TaxID=361277 RepID=UPI003982819B